MNKKYIDRYVLFLMAKSKLQSGQLKKKTMEKYS